MAPAEVAASKLSCRRFHFDWASFLCFSSSFRHKSVRDERLQKARQLRSIGAVEYRIQKRSEAKEKEEDEGIWANTGAAGRAHPGSRLS